MNLAPASAAVLGREAMRELDARTIAAGTASLDLMERAGAAIADALADEAFHGVALPERPRLLVLAGRGNNGGDGFVAARLLASKLWHCTVALVQGEPAAGGDAAANLAEWRRLGGAVLDADGARAALAGEAAGYDLGLDTIFGTGLARAVEGADADLIESLNKSGLPVVAADVPSGLCSDAGTRLGAAVRCRATLAIGAAKPGLLLGEGPDFAGRVRVADIGLLGPAVAGVARVGSVLDERTTAGTWPRLRPLSHKGSRGHVLVVAGSSGKTGAAVLAARGALRAGAGLVTVAGVRDVQAAVAAALPEAMTKALASDENGGLAISSVDGLREMLEVVDAVVAGPGLGTGPGANSVVAALLAARVPLVLDADALNAVATWDVGRRRELFAARLSAGAPAPILTPHPGEMGRLVEETSTHVQQSRLLFATHVAGELGAVVVLKGAATIVAGGRGTSPGAVTPAFNLSGNPGMAAAGMGDVLSGICGALAARLADPFEAAALAVYVHGAAGDRLALCTGAGFLAGELADEVPALLATRHPR